MDTSLDTPVEERVFQRAQRLLAVQHAVAEITGGRKVETDPVALKNAVLQVRTAVQSIPGAYCVFIGGLAVQEHGYVRWTDDVDVVVDAEHYRDVLDTLRSQGFELTPSCFLKNTTTGALVDCLKEGATLRNSSSPLPHPSLLGKNGGFVKLPMLVRLKLDTGGRMKDLADIVELLKRHPHEEETIRAALPETMKLEFERLVQQAHRELE